MADVALAHHFAGLCLFKLGSFLESICEHELALELSRKLEHLLCVSNLTSSLQTSGSMTTGSGNNGSVFDMFSIRLRALTNLAESHRALVQSYDPGELDGPEEITSSQPDQPNRECTEKDEVSLSDPIFVARSHSLSTLVRHSRQERTSHRWWFENDDPMTWELQQSWHAQQVNIELYIILLFSHVSS